MDNDKILRAYMVCALWSSTGDNDEPLDDNHTPDDLDPQTVNAMREDVSQFVAKAKPYIVAAGLDAEQVGHDFWLTRNGHGAGFWDRGLGELGDKLSTLARSFGEVWLYIGDDQHIHQA